MLASNHLINKICYVCTCICRLKWHLEELEKRRLKELERRHLAELERGRLGEFERRRLGEFESRSGQVIFTTMN